MKKRISYVSWFNVPVARGRSFNAHDKFFMCDFMRLAAAAAVLPFAVPRSRRDGTV